MKKKIVFLVSGNGGTLQVIHNACKYGLLSAYISCAIFDKSCKAIKRVQAENIPYTILNRENLSDKIFQDALYKTLKQQKPDLICLTFDSLLSEKIVTTFKNKIINLHPALLPAFPGLNSIEKSIKGGVCYTGATVHFVDNLMDNGPIICQYVTPININESTENLARRMFPYEALMMLQAVDWYIASRITIRGRRAIVDKAFYSSYPFCPALDKFNHKSLKGIRKPLFEKIQMEIENLIEC